MGYEGKEGALRKLLAKACQDKNVLAVLLSKRFSGFASY
jgi:hypothetical protein